MSHATRRSRWVYLSAALVVVAIGLLLRSAWVPLPPFVVKYGGVALWATMLLLLLATARPRIATPRLALAGLCLAWTVEFLQLYRAPWIDAIRATRPGHLVLGSTFNPPDLLAYVVGIAIGAVVDRWLLGDQPRPPEPNHHDHHDCLK